MQNLNARLEREDKRTMFIISQLHYDNLLAVLRRPENFLTKVKATGDKYIAADVADPHVETEDDIRKIIEKARNQLKKDAEILHLAMEKLSSCQVVKVIAVPNVSRELATKLTALNKDYENIHFLCEEDMFADDVTVAETEMNLDRFRSWWDVLPKQDKALELDCMKEIVGKYVGLLSTVVTLKPGNELAFQRCLKDNVFLTWRLFHRLVLSPGQVRLLSELKETRHGQRDYLSGPPGSGKTLLLTLKSKTFLAASVDHHVIVVDMYRGARGRAIGNHVYNSIRAGGRGCFEGRVHQLSIDVDELTLGSFVQDTHSLEREMKFDVSNALFVIDEIYRESFWSGILNSFAADFPKSRVLCAGLFSKNPQGFTEHSLDRVHRCTPSVQNLLYQVDWCPKRKETYVSDYGYSREMSTNGPTPLCIRHGEHVPQVSVPGCQQCAVELAAILKGEKLVASGSSGAEGACAASVESEDFLKDCRIALLVNIPRDKYDKSGDYIETTDEKYEEYMQYISNCPFIQTLQEQGINVDVKTELGCKDLEDTTQTGLFATWLYNFQGLEAGVVIVMPGDTPRQQPKSDCAVGQQAAAVPCREIPAPGLKAVKRQKQKEALPQAATQSAAARPQAATPQNPAAGPREECPNSRRKKEEDGQFSNNQSQTSPTEVSVKPNGRVFKGERGVESSGGNQACSSRASPVSREEGETGGSYKGQSRLYWTVADIQRFSAWDQTNIMVAGSRCLSLLILLVP